MPHATAKAGVKLYYEEAGAGIPIIFSHEFGGDYRSWEAQVRFFSRRYRCITYSARGYPNSDVPDDPDLYGQDQARDDIVAVLDHLEIDQAHVVGLSMGSYAALMVGISYPDRVRGLVLAAGGTGSEPDRVAEFRASTTSIADQFEKDGSAAVAATYGEGPGRVQFMNKDPRGFAEFQQWFGEHSAVGSAHTMRRFQGGRNSIWDYQADMVRLDKPTLIVCGDEDEACIRPSLFMKRHIATSGLAMFPKSGHCVSQEEPDLFNRILAEFFAQAGTSHWPARDARAEKLPMPGVDA